MKTKKIGARLSPLNENKIMRYFNRPTYRNLIESIIKLSEENSYVKNKLLETINLNRRK